MPKPATIWVDSARTRTAADVTSVEECDALIRRTARSIGEIHCALKEGTEENTSRIKNTLRIRDLALTQLKQRRDELTASN